MADQVSSLKTDVKFKDTPIGNIPVDWEVKRLISVASNEKYSFTGGPFGSDLKEDCYTDHGVRIIQLQNIGDGKFIDNYKIFTSEEKANALESCNIFPGNIIIAKMADPVARACIIPEKDNRYLMASDGIRLSVNEKENDVKFILFSINSKYFRKNAERHGTGTTRLRIGLTELKNLPIIIPPLQEQKKIAAILFAVDTAIEKTTQVIEKIEELKKGLMQRLFVDGIGHPNFKETEIGRIPENWMIKRLGDIARIERGRFAHRPRNAPQFYGGNIPFVQTADVAKSNGSIRKYSQTLNDLGLSISKRFPKGTILITIAANIGYTGILEFDSACPDSLIGITPNKDISTAYLQYFLSTQQKKMEVIAPHGAQKNINIEFLKPWKIILPPLEEQITIGKIFLSIDDKLDEEVKQKEELRSLKKNVNAGIADGEITGNSLTHMAYSSNSKK